eukprot:188255-Rhodomonas_salina.1
MCIRDSSRYSLRKRIYPWVGSGMTDEVIVRNFQRLRRCMQCIKNVWRRVGLWEKVEAPLPEGWGGSRPSEQ